MKKFYITTPIYYPNARPHVGSAYTTIACDAVARYKRMCGYDVAFLTGTDEHGEKLQRAADAAGIPVEKFVAEKRELFKNLWRTLGIPAFDSEHPAGYRFVHTSQNPAHVKSVHWMIRRAKKAGYVEKKKYEGRYCIFDERYVSDNPEPVNCDICGRPAELISEENYFFRLSAFEDRLLKLYESRPEFVLPDFRMNEVKSFVKSGLRDISISRRRLKWGIPWPDDPDQVVYVWYDALTSYLTGIGFRGSDKPKPDFEKYWMDPESERVHMIGKDILRFHAVYWPAFLMAANDALPEGERLPLPKTIFAHGWIYYEQDKMSKSKGNVVYPEPIVAALNSFGAPGNDALRYYLLRDTPFGLDGSFSYDGLVQRYNSDLANDLGNLASRVLAMIHRYFGGVIPKLAAELTQLEEALRAEFFGGSVSITQTQQVAQSGNVESYKYHFNQYYLQLAAERIGELVSRLNGYLVKRQPWKLAEFKAGQDRESLDLVLYTAADLLWTLTVLLHPIVPDSAQRLWQQLGSSGRIEDQRFCDLKWGGLEPGTKVGKPEPIFPRLDKQATLQKLEDLAQQDRAAEEKLPQVRKEMALEHERDLTPETDAVPGPEAPLSKPQSGSEPSATSNEQSPIAKITIDDFAKVDLRAGTIRAAEPIPGATKLLKLQVDIGTEVRQVCAGIAEYYKPEQLIGRKVVIVANLQPRKLRGVESNGMVVAASVGEDGRPVLVTFAEDVPNGAKLK